MTLPSPSVKEGAPCPGKQDGWDGCPSLSCQVALCWKQLWWSEPAHFLCTARSGNSKIRRRPVQHLQREGHQSANPMQQMLSASCCRRVPQWVLTGIMPAYPLVHCLWYLLGGNGLNFISFPVLMDQSNFFVFVAE